MGIIVFRSQKQGARSQKKNVGANGNSPCSRSEEIHSIMTVIPLSRTSPSLTPENALIFRLQILKPVDIRADFPGHVPEMARCAFLSQYLLLLIYHVSVLNFRHSDLGFVSDFGFRTSDFIFSWGLWLEAGA